ncbi:DUF2203 domain-containing protein [Sulfobacillus thermosulfidooxidans]|uniref:DUF2203 domain-containing protein n=1 Tax=Sulfobacillus thermosulfidooxidans (strain DSM 9293 / VKM B-1269 / AT-1) TaxID=929705 RepID=A0A1W1W7M4_SULTA|nr:DUF2203 domain-containing protein [Sulfobacillus thermosulfidooxidans]OLZ10566.1 hypothetical protein BFX05_01685 [Sulfobacillus thermosulfidooxidans]OLZ16803.1 hypothetical protein BFX06_14420 [Sulfobacillus thermosulfidooxidans]OLZ22243.1 hypothetical protein BFX07_10300 [Sulfobacillus thermosulfidooxidans]SMC02297.1 hypothetical protein SAMN00768000_0518 [Sulfobacillus thermosulfidooxidans DSM 9293]
MTRQFTLEEANQLLPLLREHLTRLRSLQDQARKKYEEMRDIREVGYRKDGNLIMLSDYQLAKKEFDQVVAEANQLLATINQLGCRVTDVEIGLVDFPAEINGQPVYLCWRVDEESVKYYHGLEEGYAGRKLIPGSASGQDA